MEGEVAAMATRLESSVGLKRKEYTWDYMVDFADDFRDVDIRGGMVATDINGWIVEETKDGKGSGDIELPKRKTKGGEAESGSKTKIKGGEAELEHKTKTKGGEAESGSKTNGTAKPAGIRKRRTKVVKYRIDKSLKPLFSMKPIVPYDTPLLSESFFAALANYNKLEKSILEQFETKGYADYEREEEVTDDDVEDV